MKGLGAVIEDASYGYAKCSMVIEPRHCNTPGIPMGGTVFTLADSAFAVASNQEGRDVVTQASQITFLKPAEGNCLTAVAKQVKDGKRVCFYEVTVMDSLGTGVAFVTINGYVVRGRGGAWAKGIRRVPRRVPWSPPVWQKPPLPFPTGEAAPPRNPGLPVSWPP